MGAGGNEEASPRRYLRWYKSPGSDRVVAREEFESLSVHGQAALAEAVKRFRRHEERAGEVRKLKDADDLWEIRVQVGTNPFRLLFFYDTDIICVAVSAFYKNQQATPKTEIRKAMRRKAEWESEGRRRQADD